MPLYNVSPWELARQPTANVIVQVTLKEDATPDKLSEAKQKAVSDGGVIKHEFTLIKGFTFVSADSQFVSFRAR